MNTATTTGLEEALSASLRWIYETEQPEGALLSHRGWVHVLGRDALVFSGVGLNGLPFITLRRVGPKYDHEFRVLNPLDVADLIQIPILLDRFGYPAVRYWDAADPSEPPGESGTFELAQLAHPTMVAAVERFDAGCLDHGGDISCGSDTNHPTCMWWRDGYALAIKPVWPQPTSAEVA